MAQNINSVKPFRALHYNPGKLGEVGLCLSEPYDVIPPEGQDAYYRQHEYNVIRLILGKTEKTDDEKNNRYTRARDYMRAWKSAGVLTASEHPSFYVYEQSFLLANGEKKELTGFIGLVRLSDYGEGRILPHEQVLKKPVEDRISLTLASGTQFEYIWGLYRDDSGAVDRVLKDAEKHDCLLDYDEKKQGVRHRLFRITDQARCRTIEDVVAQKQIYIADGHHRYQTMLNVRDEMRKKHPEAGPDAPWEFIMMFLVDCAHEDLVILPTHRLLHGLPESKIDALPAALAPWFDVTRFSVYKTDENAARKIMLAQLEKSAEPAFGIVLRNGAEYLTAALKDRRAYLELVGEPATENWKMLDVNVLNILIFRKILGITEEMMSLQTCVEYCKDDSEAIARVADGKMQAAFLLKKTPLDAVLEVSDAGEKMPRKSTFFFPKPLSGLVFYEMYISE